MENVNMMLGEDVIKFLVSNNLISKDGKILVKCLYCNKQIQLDQVQFILPPLSKNGSFRIVCSSSVCIDEFIAAGRDI